MKSNEDILAELAKYDLESDLNNKFPKVWGRLSNNSSLFSLEQPIGVLLGGQPGAGKSFATMEIKERLNDNVLVINGDEFRFIINIMMIFFSYMAKMLLNILVILLVKWLKKLEMRQLSKGLILL